MASKDDKATRAPRDSQAARIQRAKELRRELAAVAAGREPTPGRSPTPRERTDAAARAKAKDAKK